MGSTGTHREKGMSDKAFFEKEFPTSLGGQNGNGYILACTSKPAGGEWNRVFYAAVRNHPMAPYAPGEVWCLVVLMHTSRTRGAYFNFTYKDLSDAMGPGEDSCPDRILDLLTPTTSEYANEWRQRCRKRNERERQAKRLAPGSVIEFVHPYTFSNGASVTRFRYCKSGRRVSWVALDESGRYLFTCRLPATWWERNYTVLETPVAIGA